jgi:cobalt/nickel transport system permease protein
MAKIESSFLDFGYLENLSYRDTPVHRLDPRVKLLTTLIFIVTVVSFGKYELTGLIPFAIYPVSLIALGDLPPGYLFKKVLIAAPFAFFIGVFNPLLDREILLYVGSFGVSGGWVSFASIMLRFVLTVSSSLVLIASTGFYSICMGMGKMKVPGGLVIQLLFLYRYIFVMLDEATRMARARALRSFGDKGMGMKVFGYMIGQLLLRTIDRAQRIHLAMLCRGFDGQIRLTKELNIRSRDIGFLMGWSGIFLLMRLYNIPELMGRLTGAVTG